MNTIATNRANPVEGPVADIIEIAGRMMAEHSDGTRLIDGLMADCWDGSDPWGSTIEAWFSLEYACQYHGLDTDPSFRSPFTQGDPDEGFLYCGFRDAMHDEQQITHDDVVFARNVLALMSAAFRCGGLDY